MWVYGELVTSTLVQKGKNLFCLQESTFERKSENLNRYFHEERGRKQEQNLFSKEKVFRPKKGGCSRKLSNLVTSTPTVKRRTLEGL